MGLYRRFATLVLAGYNVECRMYDLYLPHTRLYIGTRKTGSVNSGSNQYLCGLTCRTVRFRPRIDLAISRIRNLKIALGRNESRFRECLPQNPSS